jgi:hypothetical protein
VARARGDAPCPKIEALHRLIKWLNLFANANIPILPLDTSPLRQNGWLAGFTDADGYFQIILQQNSKGEVSNYKAYFRLEVSKYYGKTSQVPSSYYDIMSLISENFKTKLRERERITNFGPSSTYYISTSNLESNTIVLKYYTKHSMLSSKNFARTQV